MGERNQGQGFALKEFGVWGMPVTQASIQFQNSSLYLHPKTASENVLQNLRPKARIP